MLIKCKKCGHKSRGEPTFCPSCGAKRQGIDNNRRVGIVLILFIFLCIYLFTRHESDKPKPMEATKAQENASQAVRLPVNQEQPKQEALYQELKQELEQDKTKNGSLAATPQMMVMRMLEYALDDSGLSHESEIEQTKLQIESLPKLENGNKKAARAINDKGLMFSKNGDFNNAVKMFEEANELDQSDIEILDNLGFSYFKQGNMDSAQQTLIKALTISPGRVTAWANLGKVFGKNGEINRATACFSNAYRFSKVRFKMHQFMKNLNDSEDVENIKQARAKAITWAEKAYPDISQKANQQ